MLDTKQKLKMYFEFNERVKEIKKCIEELQIEKAYIMGCLKASTISDMPKCHTIIDLSNLLANTDEIDTLIQGQLMQLQMMHRIKIECENLLDMLTQDEKTVLEKRIYGCKVFVISRKVNFGDATFFRIRNRIKDKIGVCI